MNNSFRRILVIVLLTLASGLLLLDAFVGFQSSEPLFAVFSLAILFVVLVLPMKKVSGASNVPASTRVISGITLLIGFAMMTVIATIRGSVFSWSIVGLVIASALLISQVFSHRSR